MQRQPGMAAAGAPTALRAAPGGPYPIGPVSRHDAAAAAAAPQQAIGMARQIAAYRQPVPNQIGQTGVSAGPSMQQQQAPAPTSIADATQAASQGMTPQQLAIAQAVQKQIAQQAAQRAAAYDATPAGHTQNDIANNGVFAGRQQAAAPPASGPQALPPLRTTQGIVPMAGVR